MIRESYDLIMNPEKNPLNILPKTVRFQFMMILAYMWSAIFALWVGQMVLFGVSAAGHTLLLLGFFFTADIFRRARQQSMGHRDAMRNPTDGTVLHDDIWGAPAPVFSHRN